MTKPDFYTKSVLTIIALALLWVGITLNTKSVQAIGPTPVVITGITLPNNVGGILPVGIAKVGWNYQSNAWLESSLPVAVSNSKPIAVAIGDNNSQPISVTVANTKPVAVSIAEDTKPKQ